MGDLSQRFALINSFHFVADTNVLGIALIFGKHGLSGSLIFGLRF
jgi:hypothetical protein